MADLTVHETGKSPLVEAQAEGKAMVGSKERKIVTADRKSKKGQEEKKAAEAKRLKEKALFKATLKKAADAGEGSDEDWEDLEEDFPHVKLEELLDNLKLDDGDEEEFKE
jgi:hypothetical protein